MQKGVRKTLAMTLVFLMILPAILTPQVGSTEAQQPSLSIGNRWTYKVEYLDPDTGDVVANGTTTREIIGESNFTVDTTTYNCFVVMTNHTTEYQNIKSMIYLLKSDLRTVKEDMEYWLKTGEEFTLYLISNITYDPPLEELDFPLTEGKKWNVSLSKTETVTFPGEPPDTKTTHLARNYTVSETLDRVTVDAGTFDAFVVSYRTSDFIYEQYYSSIVGGSVMELKKRRSDEQLMMRMELIETNLIGPSAPIELWVWLAIGIGIVVIAVVAIYIFIRMRKPSVAGMPKMVFLAKFRYPLFFR
jgi:hypothetical protein